MWIISNINVPVVSTHEPIDREKVWVNDEYMIFEEVASLLVTTNILHTHLSHTKLRKL